LTQLLKQGAIKQEADGSITVVNQPNVIHNQNDDME